MIAIGRINNPQAAQVFCDYLCAQNMVADWLPEGAMYVIRVRGQQHVNAARAALQHFLQQPRDPRYQRASWSHGQQQDSASASAPRALNLLSRVGPMTMALLLLSAAISLLSMFGRNESVSFHLWFHLSSILHGQIQRLIAPIFLHQHILHLLFYLLMLWQLGGMLEKRLGAKALLYLVLMVTLVSNITQYLVSGPFFGGLHGVVYGIFGYLLLRSWRDKLFGQPPHSGIIVLMLLWLLLSWSGWIGVVATAAQLSGFLLGLALGVVASSTSGVKHV